MRLIWLGVLLASLPLTVHAQTPRAPVAREPGRLLPAPGDDDPTQTSRVPSMAGDDDMDDRDDAAPGPSGDPRKGAGPLRPPPPGQQQGAGQPVRGSWVKMGTAALQALDKVNARAVTIEVKIGQTAKYGSLEIAVRGCYVRGPDQPADATAQLAIRDQKTDSVAFSGWMIRSAPYVSMLAHPIYDIRVAGCLP